jgi:uncharacterized membrane protein YcjF (UPF0283 family)
MSTEVAAVVLALAGVAAVVAVSWVFYRIGRAEDREREREQAEDAARRDEPRAPGAARERRRPLPPRRP